VSGPDEGSADDDSRCGTESSEETCSSGGGVGSSKEETACWANDEDDVDRGKDKVA